jgi:site-specific recombinase XerD
VRSYQVTLRLFCEFITDGRYGWAAECERRFGQPPAQIAHEWNTVAHVVEHEGRPGRRALTYDEVQALFDAADGLVEQIRARGRKGALAALRDAVMLKTTYAYGLRRREAAMLDDADCRRNPRAAQYRRFGSIHVRYGKASRGSPPKRRTVLTVPEMDWIVDVLVRRIATSTEPVSHDLLDTMPPSQALHRLRAVLVHGGVLPPRAEYLARIQPWLEQLLAEQPPSRANLVRAWVHWTLLRRARNRLPHRVFTAAAAHWMRSCILASIRFLTWIEATNRQLETLTQHDVDLWLTTQHTEHAYVAREFLRWARARGLTGDVAILRRPRADNPHTVTDEERWHHLDRCLGDTTLPDDVRAAGALNLLYGLTVSRISRLRTTDLHTHGDRIHLILGSHRLRLAPAVAQLVHRCATDADGWLFPGGHPGCHASAGLHCKLKRHGLPDADRSRATALINLAADLPAPVLADLLGLHIQTATAWARHGGADWAAYLSARIDTTAPTPRRDGTDTATPPAS